MPVFFICFVVLNRLCCWGGCGYMVNVVFGYVLE